MAAVSQKELSASRRDFSPRWHLIAVGAVAAALIIIYFSAVKLILN